MGNNIDLREQTERYRRHTGRFHTEEDVRLETNRFLLSQCERLGLRLADYRSEATLLYGGRMDSAYSGLYYRVIVEYKKVALDLTAGAGLREVLDGRNERDHGLRHYLINLALERHAHPDNETFLRALEEEVGVGFNGRAFVFARFARSQEKTDLFDGQRTKAFPPGVDSYQPVALQYEVIKNLELGFKKLLLYLRSIGRATLSSQSVLALFGPGSEQCSAAIPSIYAALGREIDERKNPRVGTLYQEWNRIFGDVYGEQETDFTRYRQTLLDLYGLQWPNIDMRRMLFTIQTYYNMVLKLLVFSLLKSLRNPLFSSRRYGRDELRRLFSGQMRGLGQVENFFEVQFFEWFVYSEDFDVTILQDILLTLERIEATASVIKPEIVGDVFREVYSGLMPREIRHLMGEYYTPGWLVDFVLDRAGYHGERGISLLDPSCGSGSFVIHAVKRFLEQNRGQAPQEELAAEVTGHIVGYDINPITVITAKTNYILALGDISGLRRPVSVPVYMCDSVLVPTVHAKQNEARHAIVVETSEGRFEIPVFCSRSDSDAFMREVASHVGHCDFPVFLDYLRHNKVLRLDGVNLEVAGRFYARIQRLHQAGRDGFWPVMLKNSYAPLFAKEGFDLVVGNPPWIAWKAMSDTYRRQTLDIWISYGIFEKNAYDKITTHDDFAMAVTYVAIDHYCKRKGELVFVLPQTFLKASKGGEGFRKFRVTRDGQDVPFAVTEVFDMQRIQPFRGFASNRASVVRFKKGTEMAYPMERYYECLPAGSGMVDYNDTLPQALAKIRFERREARPISDGDPRSPWMTLPPGKMERARRFIGPSAYRGRGRKGIEPCGAKGIYLLSVTQRNERDGTVLIENLIERSRLPEARRMGVLRDWVEPDYLYPMVGGRNIKRWGIVSYFYMLVPHERTGAPYRGVEEDKLIVECPKTHRWLSYFHDLLLETRVRNAKFFDKEQFPWYRLDNVGPYTFSAYHVVWREQNKNMVACVISSVDDPFLGCKTVVTDSKVLSCALDDEDEAHYLCAVLNAPPVAGIIEAYTISTQRGIDILNHLAIPPFDRKNALHAALAECSREAHRRFLRGEDTAGLERELGENVERLFGV